MRARIDPPWWWKPWLTPWFALREWWYRDRPMSERQLQRWARAEAARTSPPVCDRPSCYNGPDIVASRLEHGCVPDMRRP